MVVNIAEIKQCLDRIYDRAKTKRKELSEEDLRAYLIQIGFLKLLGYEKIGEDIRLEKSVHKKRPDVQCLDQFGIVTFIIEFKKPADSTNLKEYKSQLWDSYVVPLKARYGILTNGLRLILYERIGLNEQIILDVNLEEVTLEQCETLYDNLRKEPYNMDKLSEVAKYFDLFSKKEERRRLSDELARELFFKDFTLKKGTYFSNLTMDMIALFDHQYKKESFLTSAYDFWKRSYARKPEKVPKSWKPIMKDLNLEETEENLYKFIFCLETAYALFTRLILAKTCEDYEFPNINLYRFLRSDMETREYMGEITAVGWGISLVGLIETLRYELVESIFEEDIFYWWTDEFSIMREDKGEFLNRQWDKTLIKVSTSIRDIIYAIYKYDFSEIAGDPLGDLYQKYFDRETRKALGEFYTPKEVVNYILDAICYEGYSIVDKRLLDPATGSGTFIVDALRRYLEAAKPDADRHGWGYVIDRLCNRFHIVAFDIHPFATIMAQIHFMLELLPKYKIAIEERRKRKARFIIRRIPIFRTDSLVDERREARTDLMSFDEGKRDLKLKIPLPIKKEIKDKDFSEIELVMPRAEDVWEKTDLRDIPDYFCALQGIFDVVKYQAKKEVYELDKAMLERTFKVYLDDKNWKALVSFFTPYANGILGQLKKFREPPYKFGNGRLVKSVEDVMLAGLLKNYVLYDYVVGNPPYVRVQLLDEKQKENYKKLYESVYGKFDLYIPFIEAGVKWLVDDGRLGYITSNKFTQANYGKGIRNFLLQNSSVKILIDFGDTGVFKDVTNYPCIISVKKGTDKGNKLLFVEVKKPRENILTHITSHLVEEEYSDDYIEILSFEQSKLTTNVWKPVSNTHYELLNKIENNCEYLLENIVKRISEGIVTGQNTILTDMITADFIRENSLELDLIKPVLRGKNIKRWAISWSGNVERTDTFLLYPHVKVGDKLEAINLDDYPNVKNYLTSNKEKLEKRKYLLKAGKNWYEIWNPRDPNIFEGPQKIITPDISTNNNFTLDTEGRYCLDTCFVIVLSQEYTSVYKFILGLLNSHLLEYYLKHISPFVSGGFYRYKTQYLEKLPIKLPQNKKEQKIAENITYKADQILSQVKIKQQTEKFPHSYLVRFRGIELMEIEHIFNVSHRSLEPTIIPSSEVVYSISLGKKEEPISIETKNKADYLITALSGKKVKKGEKIKILIPREESKIKEILKEYKADKRQLEKLPISKLEDDINELVYELYGLDENDKKVIEEFLTKF